MVELEEKKSRFIAICRPLADEEEAHAFVRGIRQQYPDATHHVYAWILGGQTQLQRFSDDGEPAGTAGIPVLDALRKPGIDQAGIVVTRYFGGTLLGTGGLVHAYGKSASLAVEAAVPVRMQLCRQFQVTVGYADHDRLKHHLQLADYAILDERFGIDVELAVAVSAGQEAAFDQLCADQTSGAALVEAGSQSYRPLPPEDPPA